MFTIFFVLFTVTVIVFLWIRKKYSYFTEKNIPFVKPSFPFGNLKGLGTTTNFAYISKNIYDKFIGTSGLCGLYFFIQPVFLVIDPEIIKNILVRDFNNFSDRGIYHNEEDDPISGHLFLIEGAKWKNLREKLTPTFTSGKMKMMFDTIITVADEFKACVKTYADSGDVIEIKDILARFTTDVIGTCAFGIDCNSIKDPEAEFRVMGRQIFNPPFYRLLLILLGSSFPKISKKLGLITIERPVSNFFLRVVRETVDYRKANTVNRNDLMSLLLGKDPSTGEDYFTFHEIAAQCFMFFAAGFETTSTTMTFCLFELAQNQEIQNKTREEIQQVLAKHDGKFTYEASMEMPYLESVLKGEF